MYSITGRHVKFTMRQIKKSTGKKRGPSSTQTRQTYESDMDVRYGWTNLSQGTDLSTVPDTNDRFFFLHIFVPTLE